MIQAVVVDLDGVLRHWDNSELFALEQQWGLQAGFLFQHAFTPEASYPVITGHKSHAEWLTSICDDLSQILQADKARQLVQLWSQTRAEIDNKLWDKLKTLFPQAQLALGTNATDRLASDLKGSIIENALTFNSYDLGCMKPQPEYYENVLAHFELSPENILVIDDSAANIATAKQMGFVTLHYQEREAAFAFLEQLAQQREPQFLNIDLELYGDSLPQTLLEEWEDDVLILFVGANSRSYPGEMMVTLELAHEAKDEGAIMQRFDAMLMGCGQHARADWDGLKQRVFDFAYVLPTHESTQEIVLESEWIKIAAKYGAAVAVSTYRHGAGQ